MDVELENQKYKVIKNEKDGFDFDELKEKYGEYFYGYDFIVGDWAYGKLRLKGFAKKENKLHNSINDYTKIEDYIKNSCAFGCRYFVIEKLK